MDIVERLRQKAHEMPLPPTMELRQAADEIERLREALDHILKVNPSAENAGYIMRDVAVNALQQKESE